MIFVKVPLLKRHSKFPLSQISPSHSLPLENRAPQLAHFPFIFSFKIKKCNIISIILSPKKGHFRQEIILTRKTPRFLGRLEVMDEIRVVKKVYEEVQNNFYKKAIKLVGKYSLNETFDQ